MSKFFASSPNSVFFSGAKPTKKELMTSSSIKSSVMWFTVLLGQWVSARAGSIPAFSLLPTKIMGAQLMVSLSSSTNCVYSLQTACAVDSYWTDLTNRLGDGSTISFTFSLFPIAHFYRVVALPGNLLNLLPAAPILNPGETSLPDAVAGLAYSLQVSPAGTGKGPYDLMLSGSPPDGLMATITSNHTANASVQLASNGTNLVAGQRNQFTVSVRDAAGTNFSRLYNLRVISPPPTILTGMVTLKSGANSNIPLLTTNGTPPFTWSLVSGTLPQGVALSPTGILGGIPSDAASEINEDGRYTNLFRLVDSLTDRVTGLPAPRTSSATIVTLVRLSYYLNLILNRPEGPNFGGICVGCHGSAFPPDFSSGSALSVIDVSAGSGHRCDGFYTYVLPEDPFDSLIYEKLTSPPCGDQMPQGGPYFDYTQVGRVFRWINELTPGDND